MTELNEETFRRRVAYYERMPDEKLADRAEKTLDTAVWADENGQPDLAEIMRERLAAMDEAAGGDVAELI